MSLRLPIRPRRLRQSEAIRRLSRETRIDAADLIHPLFVQEGHVPQDIPSMPGVVRHSLESLLRECGEAVRLGIPGVALFPCISPNLKDAAGSHAFAGENLLFKAIREVKKRFPELAVMADVALDPYTSHGHDGVLSKDGRDVANDETVALLCCLAVREAEAGAEIVAPSDMMDGRVGAIRSALDDAGFTDTLILSYSAKFASAYYGPFREAVGSGPVSSKATYQMDASNVREAIKEVQLDEREGADMVMIKPAGPYLDVIRAVREKTSLPVAAYQVSGEYSQIHAAARLGWLDYQRVRDESLLAIKRAGADIIVTYFAREAAEAVEGRR